MTDALCRCGCRFWSQSGSDKCAGCRSQTEYYELFRICGSKIHREVNTTAVQPPSSCITNKCLLCTCPASTFRFIATSSGVKSRAALCSACAYYDQMLSYFKHGADAHNVYNKNENRRIESQPISFSHAPVSAPTFTGPHRPLPPRMPMAIVEASPTLTTSELLIAESSWNKGLEKHIRKYTRDISSPMVSDRMLAASMHSHTSHTQTGGVLLSDYIAELSSTGRYTAPFDESFSPTTTCSTVSARSPVVYDPEPIPTQQMQISQPPYQPQIPQIPQPSYQPQISQPSYQPQIPQIPQRPQISQIPQLPKIPQGIPYDSNFELL